MNATATSTRALRIVAILTIALVAFVATYSIANAANGPVRAAAPSQAAPAAFAGDSSGSPACACCGGAASSEPVEGSATLDGDVQRITVDTSAGFYDPNIITLAAGVPAELTFTQASG